jgi:PKD repeat protein
VAYNGAASGCNAVSGSCNPGESLFFALWPDSGYNLSCGNTTVSWLFGDNTVGSGLSPAHTFAAAGVYHVQATVSNSAGTFTYAQDARIGQPKTCSTLTQQNVSLAWTGTGCTEASASCKSADSIAFRPVGSGYDFTCPATHTYDWDFGDNSSHSALAQPSHSFAGPGTYNVKLSVSNGTSSTTITRTMIISAGIGAGDGCGTMIPGGTGNVYVTYYGDGCTATAGSCSAKNDVAFAVSAAGYDFGCAQHAYAWDFGDGAHSSQTAPLHKYTADGTYRVTVHLSHGTTGVDLTATVKVVGATPVTNRKNRGH